MSRASRSYVSTTGVGGLNQEPELSTSDQLADCLNVWAPKGRLETRPGYDPESHYPWVEQAASLGNISATVKKEVSGTFTTTGTFDDVDATDLYYIGHTAAFSSFRVTFSSSTSFMDASAEAFPPFAKPAYWDGTEWTYLTTYEVTIDANSRANGIYESNISELSGSTNVSSPTHVVVTFALPKGWESTTVDSADRYWIRWRLNGSHVGFADDGDVAISTTIEEGPNIKPKLLGVAQFPTTKRYIKVGFDTDHRDTSPETGLIVTNSASMGYSGGRIASTKDGTLTAASVDKIPGTMAVIPQFEEGFIAYGFDMMRFKAIPGNEGGSFTAVEKAEVESNSAFVGDDAPYDTKLIAQEANFPRAKYIQFFAGRLWVSGLEDDPFTIRWSAAQPFHKVWPSISAEPLMEDDNSPITGMHPLGEHMVVFKQDSIWLMIDSGLDVFGTTTFVPKKMVAGVGCVAHHSIKSIRGNLIFLSEDGLYKFDGIEAKKVDIDPETGAERLREVLRDILKGRRTRCASANWKNEQTYLLSFSTAAGSGLENDTTIAWNYDKDQFWIWDNIDAQIWLVDEGANDEEELFFADRLGNIYRFGVGNRDAGQSISWSATTQRWGTQDDVKRRVRSTEIVADNRVSTITAEVLANDETSGSSGTLTYTDSAEAAYGTATYGTDTYVDPRRRSKRLDYRKDADWWQTKVSGSNRNEKVRISRITSGYVDLGVR